MSVTIEEKNTGSGERPWREMILALPNGLLAAVQFLTVVPPIIRRPFSSAELGRAVGWFALVGAGLGAMLAGTDYVLSLLWPPGVTAAMLLVVWVLVTGALHLDGFLDSCDGLFGGRTPESRLRIMRDERAGAFAVTGGILLLLLKYACLTALTDRTSALILAPTLGRGMMSVAMVVFPYGRTEGLGRDMKDHAGWGQLALASITMLTAVVLTVAPTGAIAMGAAIVTTGLFAVMVLRRLPGFTGDSYGATCELVEASTLLVFVAGEMP